jgi:crotonobetainyl-CoA:carnitine CoA-transferase CaiB-like acyl-CoA transferase
VLAVGNDDQFRRFCAASGRADLMHDARYLTNPLRVTHRAELIPELQRMFQSQSSAEWQRRLQAAGVPYAPVQSVDEVFTLAQVQARQMVSQAEGLKLVASPIKVSGSPAPRAELPPRLGQHSEAILGELGYSREEVGQLRDSGVI